MENRKMWRVEKFLPATCPKCNVTFNKQGVEYALLLDPNAKAFETIVCLQCRHHTERQNLEYWQVGEIEDAEALVKEGFVNLTEVRAFGTDREDFHSPAHLPRTYGRPRRTQ